MTTIGKSRKYRGGIDQHGAQKHAQVLARVSRRMPGVMLARTARQQTCATMPDFFKAAPESKYIKIAHQQINFHPSIHPSALPMDGWKLTDHQHNMGAL